MELNERLERSRPRPPRWNDSTGARPIPGSGSVECLGNEWSSSRMLREEQIAAVHAEAALHGAATSVSRVQTTRQQP